MKLQRGLSFQPNMALLTNRSLLTFSGFMWVLESLIPIIWVSVDPPL